MLKVELHSHTSDDPIDRIPHTTHELIDRAAALGYDALAITLHDRQLDVQAHAAYASARNLVLIPGIERTIGGRHVLLLNFSAAAETVETFDDIAALKREGTGLVVAPHPYFPGPSLFGELERHADLFDAVEYNAMYTSSLNFNAPAVRWAQRHQKPMVGNCDVHRLAQLGTTCTLVTADRDPASICREIREGRAHVVTAPLPWSQAISLFASIVGANHFGIGGTAQPARAAV